MSDLMYASIVILIIWAGVFIWVVGLDRRLRRLEKTVSNRPESAADVKARMENAPDES